MGSWLLTSRMAFLSVGLQVFIEPRFSWAGLVEPHDTPLVSTGENENESLLVWQSPLEHLDEAEALRELRFHGDLLLAGVHVVLDVELVEQALVAGGIGEHRGCNVHPALIERAETPVPLMYVDASIQKSLEA